MKALVFVVALTACGGTIDDHAGRHDNAAADDPGRAVNELLIVDMALPVLDMTWDPSAYPDVCNSCPSIGTGGHSLK